MSAIADQMHREYADFIDDAYIHGSFDWIGYADQESTLQKIWEACQCHDLAERMARINQVMADEIAACAQRHVDYLMERKAA